MATLVDTNVLIDMTRPSSQWHEWAHAQVQVAAGFGQVVINQIILAEFSIRYETMAEVDHILPPRDFVREDLPWSAAFAASRAFREYKQAGGKRERTLPDFFIGAHAAVSGHSILTRDVAGYRAYFPMIELVTPQNPWGAI